MIWSSTSDPALIPCPQQASAGKLNHLCSAGHLMADGEGPTPRWDDPSRHTGRMCGGSQRVPDHLGYPEGKESRAGTGLCLLGLRADRPRQTAVSSPQTWPPSGAAPGWQPRRTTSLRTPSPSSGWRSGPWPTPASIASTWFREPISWWCTTPPAVPPVPGSRSWCGRVGRPPRTSPASAGDPAWCDLPASDPESARRRR